jgi:two-component system C4-dicarboxylate transport sensor histidine kinase DctB
MPGRFYGIGTVSREAGYYFSHTVGKNGKVLGVAAVKVNLERLDEAWGHEGEKIVVADGNGVIFLSSEPNWKYRTLNSLSSETMGRLAATRQYTEAGRLSPLGMKEKRALADGSAIVQVNAEPLEKREPGASVDYLVHGDRVLGTNWRLLVMSELTPARLAARNTAALTVLTFVLLATLALYFQQRRRIVRQTLAARLALERANDELERNVEERTLALRDANRQLQGEIGERMRAEEALRATLVDLVHTAKMAVLGQMSAGITHELNQPLTALRTLSSNAIVLLERGHSGQVGTNLQMISHLTEHMGKITSQLKKFARKSPPDLQPVLVSTVLTDALFLLTQSMRTHRVAIEQRIEPPNATALCDANRLEQVLLNILGNAIDAVDGVDHPRIFLRVSGGDEWIDVEVHDNGIGIADDVAPRLFEPFFSTKEQGMGLGLGLAISADIARDLGGSLRASESHVLGGAMFVLRLRAYATLEASHA